MEETGQYGAAASGYFLVTAAPWVLVTALLSQTTRQRPSSVYMP